MSKDFLDYVNEADEIEDKKSAILDAINSIQESDEDTSAEEKAKYFEKLNSISETIDGVNARIQEGEEISDEDKLKYIDACEEIESDYDEFGLGEDSGDPDTSVNPTEDDAQSLKNEEESAQTGEKDINPITGEGDPNKTITEDDANSDDDRYESEIRSHLGSMQDITELEPNPLEVDDSKKANESEEDLSDDDIIKQIATEEENIEGDVETTETDENGNTVTVHKKLDDILDVLGLGDGKAEIKVVFEQALNARVKKGLKLQRESLARKHKKLVKQIFEAATVTSVNWFNKNRSSIIDQAIVNESMNASKIIVKALQEQKYNIAMPKNANLVQKYKALAEQRQRELDGVKKVNKVLMTEQKQVIKQKLINEKLSSLSTDSARDTFKNIASQLIFEDTKDFSEKLNILAEQYKDKTTKNILAEKFKNQKVINEQLISKNKINEEKTTENEQDQNVAALLKSKWF